MVRFRHIFSLCLVGLLLFSSCSKDSSTTPTDSTAYTLTAKVDGVAWDGTSTASASNTSLGGLQPLVINGVFNGLEISIRTSHTDDTGSNGFDAQFKFSTAKITEGSKVWSTANGSSFSNGSIHVTKLTSSLAEGTFNFTAISASDTTNKRIVTDGKFLVKLN
ncbi:MAG: hypothetical protein HYZ54_01685 [Ignavibacteriae bacterium]|nr:hypothetical protein [Ignavibacteriota bacterium]